MNLDAIRERANAAIEHAKAMNASIEHPPSNAIATFAPQVLSLCDEVERLQKALHDRDVPVSSPSSDDVAERTESVQPVRNAAEASTSSAGSETVGHPILDL